MADAVSNTTPHKGEDGQSRGILRALLFALLVAALIISILFIWRHYHNKSSTTRPPAATASQVEEANKSVNDKNLSAADYKSYQITQRTLANQYLINKETAEAERVMNETFSKVPANKVEASSYMVMVNIEKAKADKVLYKKYLQLLIAKLKADGNSDLAAQYQKVLDKQ